LLSPPRRPATIFFDALFFSDSKPLFQPLHFQRRFTRTEVPVSFRRRSAFSLSRFISIEAATARPAARYRFSAQSLPIIAMPSLLMFRDAATGEGYLSPFRHATFFATRAIIT
jgi:hypothetical protein